MVFQHGCELLNRSRSSQDDVVNSQEITSSEALETPEYNQFHDIPRGSIQWTGTIIGNATMAVSCTPTLSVQARKILSRVRIVDPFGKSSDNEFLHVEYEGTDAFLLWKHDFVLFSQKRPPYFAQIFGINRSSRPALVFHEHLIPLSEALEEQRNVVFTITPYEALPVCLAADLRLIILMDPVQPVAVQMSLNALLLLDEGNSPGDQDEPTRWKANSLLDFLWVRAQDRLVCIGPSASAVDMDQLMPQIHLLREALECSEVAEYDGMANQTQMTSRQGFLSVISLVVPSILSPMFASKRDGNVCIGPALFCPTNGQTVYTQTEWKPKLVVGRSWKCNFSVFVIHDKQDQWNGWTRVKAPACASSITASCRVKLSRRDLQLLQLGYVSQCDSIFHLDYEKYENWTLQLIESLIIKIKIDMPQDNRDLYCFIEPLQIKCDGLAVHGLFTYPAIFLSPDPSGRTNVTSPNFQLSMQCEYRPRFATPNERNTLRLYHEVNGFNATTTQCAQMLGMPIFAANYDDGDDTLHNK
ncbi:hypothetical protein VNI00_004711 [Paramarasmius palmivorus]|uniref:Uncharacterized protein n=1 Tax=Paramarasmius palmivorus TaxID=297713 RepID=A0AAW0DIT3_9AGAR